ncbi:hypothetical protein BDN72DRAFT_871402 [Pluteus cervinus]|uniref:Uncharacterized protein n=1 Tax=Pluteus cervinus TaxID=181527 RepID=A0ACD3AMV2_9AGAR|nr:hypothetical protein BDN72DRAFT_871402 [Pluteus cervinus]
MTSTPSMSVVTIHNNDYDMWDAWLHKIYENTQKDNWFMPSENVAGSGVALRVENGFFRVFPYENPNLIPFEAAVRGLNPVVAVKVKNAAVHAAMGKVAIEDECLYIDQNTRIQILDRIDQLPQAEKDQCGAFIREDRSLILWSYSIENILPLCNDFEEKLIQYIWRNRNVGKKGTTSVTGTMTPRTHTSSPSMSSSQANLNEKPSTNPPSVSDQESAPEKNRPWYSWRLQPRKAPREQADPEKGDAKRKLILFGPVYAGAGAGLSAYFMTAGISVLLQEFALDRDASRFLLLLTMPVIFCVSLFFCLQLVGNLSLIIGPVAQYHENSMYYSAIKPAPNPEIDNNLPHITIQLPVYKESLELTIAPSVYSIKKAMQTYARQGGTSAIFICDDGLQLVNEELRQERIAFYANHNIGWVARPGHDSKPGGFKRAGKFKKASNMNYGLALSLKLEKFLAQLEAEGAEDDPNECLEDRALRMAADEMFEESGGKWRPWACNGKSLRMGEIILIIDADTEVPEDCFRDAAHEDGTRKQWSEANVSEDFNMALRLLLTGYTLRWATYSDGGFKEGVSLTVVDELNRWQKYAYGCNEIIFNPVIHWWRKGPISAELRGFVWSKAPVHYKIGMMAYGIAAATMGSILNYLLLGIGPSIDRFYLKSFEILLACTVVFPGIGNVGFTLLEYRLGHRSFFGALFENLRWLPFFSFFFGGLSIHLSTAMLAHMFSYDMTWGSTGKEVEKSTFFEEVPRIWARFKLAFTICFLCIAMMVIFTTNIIPFEWQIPGWNWAIIIPLSLVVGCHILFPIVLNPWLMVFSY